MLHSQQVLPFKNGRFFMVFAAVIFFVLAAFTVIIGTFISTGVSIELVQILAVLLLLAGVISYLGNIRIERKKRLHS